MWDEVLRVAVSNGIFAVLFCSLLIYELKITGKRENKYQKIIDGLTQSLMSLKKVENDMESVERLLEGVLGNLTPKNNSRSKESEGRSEDKNERYKKIESVVCDEKA